MLWLNSCFVGEQLNISNARFNRSLLIESCVVNEALLGGAYAKSQLSLQGTEIKYSLELNGIKAQKGVLLDGLKFKGVVRAVHADFGGGLSISASDVLELDLRGSTTEAVWDEEDAWPESLRIEGFEYSYIYNIDDHGKEAGSLADRSTKWIVDWLAKQKKYSPQPYQQCAKVLREAGQPWKAAEVLYAGKEREREEAKKKKETARWLWLTFLKGTIGYGLTKRFVKRPAAWALALLIVGFFIFWLIPGAFNYRWWWALGYSLNRLLPVVTLHPGFAKLQPLGIIAGAWFIFQTLCGWALALLIAAGLAGVGKPGGRD